MASENQVILSKWPDMMMMMMMMMMIHKILIVIKNRTACLFVVFLGGVFLFLFLGAVFFSESKSLKL